MGPEEAGPLPEGTTTATTTLIAMATSLSTAGPLSKAWFLQPIQAHNPNSISIGSAVFAQIIAECPYTLQWDAPFPFQNCSFLWGDLDSRLIHGSLGPPKSSTQTASQSVQSFLQGLLVWQTDRQTNRPTDHTTQSVTVGRIYVRT